MNDFDDPFDDDDLDLLGEPMVDDPGDPLELLREQIRLTTEAAHRLAAETEEARASEVPPNGWATEEDHSARQQELTALVALVEALRDLVPPELKQQVRDVVRQLLLLVRALIDWWVERIEAGPAPAPRGASVEDIPID